MKTKFYSSFVLFLFVMLLFPLGSFAEADKATGTASIGFFSSNTTRGVAVTHKGSFQPSISASYAGLTGTLWADYNLSDAELAETDMVIDYNFNLKDFIFNVGYIYYGYDSARDTQEFYLSLGYDIILNPKLTVYYDFDEADNGFFITAGVDHMFTLNPTVGLGLAALASFNIESKVAAGDYTGFHHMELVSTLPLNVFDNFVLEPKLGFSFPLSKTAADHIKDLSSSNSSLSVYGGISAIYRF